MAVVLKAL